MQLAMATQPQTGAAATTTNLVTKVEVIATMTAIVLVLSNVETTIANLISLVLEAIGLLQLIVVMVTVSIHSQFNTKL